MSRLHERLLSEMSLLTKLTATGEGAPSLEEKCRMAEMIRAESPEGSQRLDRMLIGNTAQLREGLNKAQAHLREMKEMLDKLTAPPWHVGVFLRLADMPDGQRAMVQYGSGRRMVQLADGLSPESLETGDEVFFNNEISMVICKSPCGLSQVGETALFGRYTDDGRLVLRWRDDELIVDAAAPLAQIELQQGRPGRRSVTV
jgi:hypothetical protein